MSLASTHTNLRFFNVGDYVVDRNLGSGTSSGGHGDGEYALVLGRSHALERAHIGELGVGDNHADGLSGIHGGAAADGDDVVGAAGLEGGYAGLYVFDGGVGLNVGVNLVSQTRAVQYVSNLLGYAELDQIGVGADKRLLNAMSLRLVGDYRNGALAMIRNTVKNYTISH